MMRRAVVFMGLAIAFAAVWWWRGSSRAPPRSASGSSAIDIAIPVSTERDVQSRPKMSQSGVVRDAWGKPIANADVFISPSRPIGFADLKCDFCDQRLMSCKATESAFEIQRWMEAHAAELNPLAQTRTNAHGEFRFSDLSATSYSVWARADGFGDAISERAAPGDPVELVLPRSRSIHGQLRGESNEGILGSVYAISHRPTRIHQVPTDRDGRFHLGGLGEGPFYILGTSPGRISASRNQFEPDQQELILVLRKHFQLNVTLVRNKRPVDGRVTLTGDHLLRTAVTHDGNVEISQLGPGEYSVRAEAQGMSAGPQSLRLEASHTQVTLELEPGGRVLVTIVDEQGFPIPAPTVAVSTRGERLLMKTKLETGALGIIGPLVQGAYILAVSAVGFEGVKRPLTIAQGESSIEIVMTRTVSLSGRVIDEYGRIAPGISVLVTPTGDSINTDADGRFSIAVPTVGQYGLHAHHSDWGGVDTTAIAPKENIELQLDPKASVDITVSIAGRRVEGAHALLSHPDGVFRSDRASGADGVVRMRGLSAGSYTLVVSHTAYLSSERIALTLHDGDRQNIQVELRDGVSIRGEVVDTQGEPLSGVSVSIYPVARTPSISDSKGQFEFAPLPSDRTYNLRVTQRGYEQVGTTQVRSGSVATARIVVKRQSVFRGRVLGEGKPLKQFRVDEFEVSSPDGHFELALPSTPERLVFVIDAVGFESLMVDRPNTKELGTFDLKRADDVTGMVQDRQSSAVAEAIVSCDVCEQSVLSGPDGRFVLAKPPFQHEFTIVAKKGRQTASRTVRADAIQDVQMTLSPAVKLSGTVTFPDGRLAAGVAVSGISALRNEMVNAVTDPNGRYAVDVPPGNYRFVVDDVAFRTLGGDPPATIVTLDGESMQLDFGPKLGTAQLLVTVKPTRGFALWLIRGATNAVGNPPMELLSASWAMLAYSPRSPKVVFSGLQPGRYTVVWASFHAQTPQGPALAIVDVAGVTELSLVQH